MSRLATLVESNRLNAVVSWVLVASLVGAAVASVVVGEPVWSVFAAGGIAVVLLPAVARRDPSVMPPWEVLVFVALPIASQFLALPDVLADLTSFLAILGLAVLVVVELHEFTPVVMTPRFAVGFVVLVTMATAGVWTVVQYASDVWFGTALVGTKTTLMWDLVLATAVAVVAGPALAVYFRWLDAVDVRGIAAGEGA
jgi:hypothetical protein